MGKQKRKQAEPEVSNKALKLDKKSKPATKQAPKSAESSPRPPKTKIQPASKSPAVKKSEKKRPADAEAESDLPLPQLPTVVNDTQLKQIVDKAKKAEQEAKRQEKQQQQLEEKKEGEEVTAAREVVKVRRSQPALKLKESTAKSYLAISGPAEDNKTVKVPSYSYIKNRGIVYIRYATGNKKFLKFL
jgi:uncharacterized protein (UPF0335 family)